MTTVSNKQRISNKSLFSRLFPTPAFLKMPAIGIDLSQGALRCVEFSKGSRGLVVRRFIEKVIPDFDVETISDEDMLKVKTALESLKKEFGIRFVHASIPEDKAYLFKVEIPFAEAKNIAQAVELKIEENVPLKVAETMFDFDVIPREENQDHVDVSVSVLPIKVVEGYISLFQSAGLVPLSFEVEARAIARAVVPALDKETYLVINFGKVKTGIYIVCDGIVQFSSSLAVGGDVLTEALARELKISLADADKMKKEQGFVQNKENLEVFSHFVTTMSSVKDELSRVVNYWNTRAGHGHIPKKIEKVILLGSDSSLSGFAKYVSFGVKSNVSTGNVWVNVISFDEHIPQISYEDSLNFATAIGLAIPKK